MSRISQFAVVVLCLVAFGCSAFRTEFIDPDKNPEIAGEWRISQNGEECKQLWNDDTRFNHPTAHEPTSCRCDQLITKKLLKPKKNVFGKTIQTHELACPVNNTKESYYTKQGEVVYAKSPAENFVAPAIHGLAFLGGTLGGAAIISGGLRNIPASTSNVTGQDVQSVSTMIQKGGNYNVNPIFQR